MELDTADVQFDTGQVFLIYATFGGDVVRTAHAVGLRPMDVLKVADEEGWVEKLKPIIELSKSQRPGDFERAMNRAVNWAQCHRARMFLERVLNKVCNLNNEELKEYIFTAKTNKEGVETARVLSTRALADLASALEKVQAMTYQALGDTAQDRGRRKEQTGDTGDCGALNIRIAEAMAKVKMSSTPRAQLFEAQLTVAEAERQKAVQTRPEASENPLDSDEH